MPYRKLLWVSVAAIALAASAWAGESLTAYEVSKVGGVFHLGLGAYQPQAMIGGVREQSISKGFGLGSAFAGPTLVESVTITQMYDGYNRNLAKSFDVYANGELVGTVTLADLRVGRDVPPAPVAPVAPTDPDAPDYAELLAVYHNQKAEYDVLQAAYVAAMHDIRGAQTAPILNSGGQPVTVTATWLTLVLREQYAVSDPWTVIGGMSFSGTPNVGPAETNLNAGRSFDFVGNSGVHGYDGRTVIDGNLFSSLNNAESLFYDNYSQHQNTEQSFTVFYDKDDGAGGVLADPQRVGSVGIAFLDNYGNRSIPKWVIISGSEAGQRLLVEIDFDQGQYNRYDHGWLVDAAGEIIGDGMLAFESVFSSTAFLKLTFPEWTGVGDSANWWLGGSEWFGLTEFQAFATSIPRASVALVAVPEPATMTLLALGGLAMLRRRR